VACNACVAYLEIGSRTDCDPKCSEVLGATGGNLDSPKVTELVKVLIGRGYFSSFRAIFPGFSQFRGFLAPHFLIFDTFQSPRHGILAPRMPPCVVAHRQQELKPRNWAPKVSFCPGCGLRIKCLVLLGLMGCEYSREV
jgi:hypothetical protein